MLTWSHCRPPAAWGEVENAGVSCAMQPSRAVRLGAAILALCRGRHVTTAQAPPQTFRTTTRLIEVSVVVTDRDGNPVSDLRREDFTLTEDRVPQPISIFQVNGRTRTGALPESRRCRRKACERSATAVDHSSGCDERHSSRSSERRVRQPVVRPQASGQLPEGLARRRPLRDLCARRVVAGRSTISRPITRHSAMRSSSTVARPSAIYDASNEAPRYHWPKGHLGVDRRSIGNMAEFFAERRAWNTFDAFRALAGHLSGIAGRKSLVWLSEAFPMPMDWAGRSSSSGMRRAMQALSDAQVAFYPVDARGLIGAQQVDRVGRVTVYDVCRHSRQHRNNGIRCGGNRGPRIQEHERPGSLDSQRRGRLAVHVSARLLPADTKWNGQFRSYHVDVNRKRTDGPAPPGLSRRGACDRSAQRGTSALREALQGPLQSTKVGLQRHSRTRWIAGDVVGADRSRDADVRA